MAKHEIEAIELEPLEAQEVVSEPPPWHAPAALKQWLREKKWYLATVIVPTLVTAIYFIFVAGDRYESEARFVVRSPSSSVTSQLTNLVQGSGIVRSADDAFIVQSYMKSRDAVRALVSSSDLLARLQRSEADVLWRYPGFLRNPTAERLWQHFQNFIQIDFDSSTGITTLRVQAFTPEDAEAISKGLLDSSERLINTMSIRAHEETLKTASKEVERARIVARETLENVTKFRNTNELIDPSRISTASLELISRLAYEKALTKAELDELKSVAADSPQTKTLMRRITAYDDQISEERKALAGSDTSLAPLIAEYERLSLERQFAERTFASAQTAYDIALVDSERQRLFIERISVPSKPDYPKYPYRLLDIASVYIVCWLLFAIARRLVSDARGHAGN